MSKLALFSGPGGVVAGGAVALGAAIVGFAIWQAFKTPEIVVQTAQPATQVDTARSEPAGQKSPSPVADASQPVEEAEAAGAPVPTAPSFDLVRVAPDGAAQIAGTAMPGALVEVLLDRMVIGSATAGTDGSFAAFLDLPPSDAPRVMNLRVGDATDGQVSDQDMIIAPTSKPAGQASEQVAAAAPATDSTGAVEPVEDVAAAVEPAEDVAKADIPAVLVSDAQGVRVLQPATPAGAAPDVMSNVALDSISYSESGEVELAGRGNGDGFVRIYLDNTPVTTSRIAPDGRWRTDLPEVDTGVYTLRVDQVADDGTVISRVETPFKREDSAQLASVSGTEAAPVRAITVQPGNTLWAIARERYGEGTLFVRVYEANRDRIRNPDLIYPGQVFELPQN